MADGAMHSKKRYNELIHCCMQAFYSSHVCGGGDLVNHICIYMFFFLSLSLCLCACVGTDMVMGPFRNPPCPGAPHFPTGACFDVCMFACSFCFHMCM